MTPTAIATRSDRIQRTLEHLRQHTTDTTGQLVPFGPGQYTDPGSRSGNGICVFGRVPSIVAHASELPEPNDFITLQMPRNRVIVARQLDGSVKAFVNVCRHRGALLEEQAERALPAVLLRVPPVVLQHRRVAAGDHPRGHVRRGGPVPARADRAAGAGAARPDLDGRPGGRADRRRRLAGPGDGRDPGRVPARRADRLPVRGVRRAGQLEADAGRVRGQLPHPVRAPEHGGQAHPHQRADRGGLRPARPDGEPAQGHRPVAGGGPGRYGPRPVCHRGALPAAEQHAAAPARRPLRAAHLPAASGRPRALPDGDAAAGPAAGSQRDGAGALLSASGRRTGRSCWPCCTRRTSRCCAARRRGWPAPTRAGCCWAATRWSTRSSTGSWATLLAEGSAP